ncbi:39S ribosomal protein L21, mitochondrial [Culex quinquefasciatus]|uniref:Large ribosomal subunit protein bL21m n=1 Tax=Culex quinquefasciatus TaxID=7176 RepID=B0XJY5_CULQU|nr:39S ribosomal protein L21, mitochondrial [Culex quinquefasciatus]|eukprot:XP_001869957.1 39S ribosomal protein L21, mitochondrial [Culex quinquefasciatus]
MFLNRLAPLARTSGVVSIANAFKALSLGATTPQTAPALTTLVCKTRFNSSLAAPLPSGSVVKAVNAQLASASEGRLFAVVQLCGKQFKITSGDIIIVEGYWPPTNGDRIRLDKVLLAGGKDFSLIGRPLVPAGLVDVQATIIEKSLSHTKTHFRKKRRKQYMRINFFRAQQTMIRINSIELSEKGVPEQPTASREEGERFF